MYNNDMVFQVYKYVLLPFTKKAINYFAQMITA